MSFWKPTKTKKMKPRPLDTGQAVPARKNIRHSSPVVFEAKMLAIEAVNCGADRQDIAKILGINPTTISTDSDSRGRMVSSGIYFMILEAAGEYQTQSMALLR
jgi:hypothetical protein